MSFFKKFANVAALGCLGLCLNGFVACSSDEGGDTPEENPVNPSTDPETGEQLKPEIDTVTYKDSTGKTVIKIDTLYVTYDDTLRWVGNSALKITEVTPINLNWLDEDGEDPGWVEIYNTGSDTANLKGYTLVENLKNARKWFFGNVKIAPHGFITIFCDKKDLNEAPAGQDKDSLHYRPHTNWKLEKDQGSIYLIDPYYGIRDSVAYPTLDAGVSWGITDGGVWKYFGTPTPEKPNTASTAYDGVAPEFTFSGAAGGFYNDEVVLTAPNVSGGLSVRCTQDGSVPTKDSPEFNQDISITKNTVLRCAAFKDGLLTKKVVTNTYFINETVGMPVVSVSVDPSFFVKYYKKTDGGTPDMDNDQMYAPNDAYPNDSGEMPAHVEYFEKGSSSDAKAWEIDAGISLMGGWSRMERKKSLAVVMREEYQSGWLDYPLFETRKETSHKFKGFNLRNNGNRFVSDYFADAVGGAILEGSGVDYQRSRQVVVFYNGTYYGIHDMRERYNKNYVESNYDIDASTVNFIKHINLAITASNGTTDDYESLLAYVAAGNLADSASYAYVKSMMDVGNYADYMLAEMYIHNGDWPNNNVRAWRSPDHPWKFMIYDLDHGFDWDWSVSGFGESTNMFTWVKQGGYSSGKCYKNPSNQCFHTFYVRLMDNDNFKRLFINHASVMLNTYLTGKNVTEKAEFLASMLKSADVERDMAVEAYKNRRQSYGSFDPYGEKLGPWAEDRDDVFASELKSEFGLSGTVSMTISANGNGKVLMEGMTLPGTGSYTGKFFSGVDMELTAVTSDGSIFTGWSDGSKENPHIVTPTEGMTISATFK